MVFPSFWASLMPCPRKTINLRPSLQFVHSLFFSNRVQGNLRFRKPVPFEIFSDRNAQSYGSSCPQQKTTLIPTSLNGSAKESAALARDVPILRYAPAEESEDCTYPFSQTLVSTHVLTSVLGLTINVIRPLDTDPEDRYPVVVVSVLAALIC